MAVNDTLTSISEDVSDVVNGGSTVASMVSNSTDVDIGDGQGYPLPVLAGADDDELPGLALAGDVGAKLDLEVLMLGGDAPKLGAPLVKVWRCTDSRHSSKMPHRLTPAAPPSMRTKVMALAPCGMITRLMPSLAASRAACRGAAPPKAINV